MYTGKLFSTNDNSSYYRLEHTPKERKCMNVVQTAKDAQELRSILNHEFTASYEIVHDTEIATKFSCRKAIPDSGTPRYLIAMKSNIYDNLLLDTYSIVEAASDSEIIKELTRRGCSISPKQKYNEKYNMYAGKILFTPDNLSFYEFEFTTKRCKIQNAIRKAKDIQEVCDILNRELSDDYELVHDSEFTTTFVSHNPVPDGEETLYIVVAKRSMYDCAVSMNLNMTLADDLTLMDEISRRDYNINF